MTRRLGKALFVKQQALFVHFLRDPGDGDCHEATAHKPKSVLGNSVVEDTRRLRLDYHPASATFDDAVIKRVRNDDSTVSCGSRESQEHHGHDNYAAVAAKDVSDHDSAITAQKLTRN